MAKKETDKLSDRRKLNDRHKLTNQRIFGIKEVMIKFLNFIVTLHFLKTVY